MKLKTAFSLCLIIVLLCSCEGVKPLSGTVIDGDTGLPVENAEIIQLAPQMDTVYTGSLGEFYLSSGFVSLVWGGPSFILDINKAGYKTKTIKKSKGDVIVKIWKEPSR